MKCPNCGRHVKSNAKFCLHCGYPLQNDVKSNKALSKHHHFNKKMVGCLVGVLVIIILIIGGIWCKRYFTPAQAFSRQLPKSTWIESNQSHHKKSKKNRKGKNKKSKVNKKRKKNRVHHSYIVSNGQQLLSFGKNKKSTRIFNTLSSNSSKGKMLENNLSKNMKNVIIQDHYSYHIKGNGLYFKDGTSYRDVKKNKKGYTFKCYKGKRFLHTETVKVYKSLKSPIK